MLHHANRAAAYARRYRFVGTTSTVSTGTSYTFTGVSLGAASLRRRILVCVLGGPSGSITASVSSVTVGGASTTLVAGPARVTSAAFAYIDNNSDTTGDVVVNFSANKGECTIAIYNLINLKNSAQIGSAFPAGVAATSVSTGNLSVSSGGFVIAQLAQSTVEAVTWTNATQDSSVSPAAGIGRVYASSITPTTTSTYSITASWATVSGTQISAISFA